MKYNTRQVETFALLDEGSDITLCSSSLIRKLGAKGAYRELRITTVNQSTQRRTGIEVNLKVSSLDGNETIDLSRAWSVEKLPISLESLPTGSEISKWSHLAGMDLPKVSAGQVELLIGSDTPEAFWVEEERKGRRGEPYAIRSILGWSIIGPTGKTSSSVCNVHFQQSGSDINSQIERL